VLRDIAYNDAPDADPKQKLDLYLPTDVKRFPVLFFVHGGAWTIGDRRMFGSLGPVFARNGIGVVMISYRLSPKVKHPAHIEDVARAFAWTHAHINEYGGRADRIFVSGQSAGGHLAALLATNERYLAAHGKSLRDIRAAIPISGVYRIRPGFLKNAFGDDLEMCVDASPLDHVGGDEPPFSVIFADRDMPGCDMMSRRFVATLQAKKSKAEIHEIPDRNHVSIMMKMMVDENDPTVRAMFRFIARHCEAEVQTPVAGPAPAPAGR
jgi:acetyl esterase/lipase